MKRLYALLRSRRLAAVLLVAVTAYAWVSTLIPLRSAGAEAVVAWDARHPTLAVVVNALGLHDAYTNPVFLAVAALLLLSTAACAWERTDRSVRAWRSIRRAPETVLARVRTSPAIEVAGGFDTDATAERAAAALRSSGLRVSRAPWGLVGSSGAFALVGSPLFHWCLVGLFVFAGAGRLTRYEGHADIPVGETIADTAGSYSLALSRGALSGGAYTGAGITVVDIASDHVVGGISRGTTPLVGIVRDGVVQRPQWVYANSPLRHGPLLIHSVSSGRAFIGTVRVTGTDESRRMVLVSPPEAAPTEPSEFSMFDAAADATITVTVTPVSGQRVRVETAGGTPMPAETVGVGESATIGEGLTLSVDALSAYARLRVVNDWSVPWIYAMFVLGSTAAALTAFVPSRIVHVSLVRSDDGSEARILIDSRAMDPAFAPRVRRALEAALRDGDGAVDERTHE